MWTDAGPMLVSVYECDSRVDEWPRGLHKQLRLLEPVAEPSHPPLPGRSLAFNSMNVYVSNPLRIPPAFMSIAIIASNSPLVQLRNNLNPHIQSKSQAAHDTCWQPAEEVGMRSAEKIVE